MSDVTTTEPSVETLEEIAHRITAPFFESTQLPTRFAAYSAILSALRNERERAAKIAETHEGHGEWCASAAGDCQSLTIKAVAAAIRKEE